MPRKRPVTKEQTKKMLGSKELQEKLEAIKESAQKAGNEPDDDNSLVLGPKDELANKRLVKLFANGRGDYGMAVGISDDTVSDGCAQRVVMALSQQVSRWEPAGRSPPSPCW